MPTPDNVPPTMRAWTFTKRGHPSQILQLDHEYPTPSPENLKADDVLVKVIYVGLQGGTTFLMPIIPPMPLSWDKGPGAIPEMGFSGIIVALGSNVSTLRPELKVEAQVFGLLYVGTLFLQGKGVLAEYTIAAAPRLALVESQRGNTVARLSLRDASSIGASGITAIEFLEASNLKKGEKVFVNGGSSGTGTAVVQIARMTVGPEGRVVATCSAANAALVKSLGADEVIDYREHHPLAKYLAAESPYAEDQFDAAIDCIGIPELYGSSPSYLATGKPFLNIGSLGYSQTVPGFLNFFWIQMSNLFWPKWLGGIPRPYVFFSAKVNWKNLERVRELVEDGDLHLVVDSVWEMQDVPKAYEIMEKRRAKGKVIIHIQD